MKGFFKKRELNDMVLKLEREKTNRVRNLEILASARRKGWAVQTERALGRHGRHARKNENSTQGPLSSDFFLSYLKGYNIALLPDLGHKSSVLSSGDSQGRRNY